MDVKLAKEFFIKVVENRERSEKTWLAALDTIKSFKNHDIWNLVSLIDISYFGGELSVLEKNVPHKKIKKLVEGITPKIYTSSISQPQYLMDAEVRFSLYAAALYLRKEGMLVSPQTVEDLADCMIQSLFYLKPFDYYYFGVDVLKEIGERLSSSRRMVGKLWHIPVRRIPTRLISRRTLREYPEIKFLDLTGFTTIHNRDLATLSNLTDLNLTANEKITCSGLTHLTNLQVLNLRENDKVDNTCVSSMINLLGLNLRENHIITDDCLVNLTNLKSLNLNSNRNITDEALIHLTNLTSLDLTMNNTITNRGLLQLVNLESLYLSFNRTITNEALIPLANLTFLDLTFNNTITNEALLQMSKLKILCVFNSNSNILRGISDNIVIKSIRSNWE